MNSRERFRATCRFEPVDRPFRFETIGFWPETIERWRGEGLPEEVDPLTAFIHFGMDLRMPLIVGDSENPGLFPTFEERIVEENGEYRIRISRSGALIKEFQQGQSALPQCLEFPVKDMRSFEEMKWRLDPSAPGRLGEDWNEVCHLYKESEVPVVMYVCGLFGTARHLLGFENLMFSYYDNPKLIHALGEQWTRLHTGVLEQVATAEVDAVYFWEDMSYKNGPMIGPKLFREFMSPYYRRVIDCGRSVGIEVFEVDTDGNFELLIPFFLEAGVNMFLPFEVQADMDVREVRKKYGRRVIIEGGLDKRALAVNEETIKKEVESKVPFLRRDGGYIAALDHLAPPDISLKNFEFFLDMVREIR
ncbi:MAG: hypothetical protein Kow0099_23000 [Candidatus Abyssubacteria bacterium]